MEDTNIARYYRPGLDPLRLLAFFTAGLRPFPSTFVLAGTILFFLSLLGTPARYFPGPIVYLGRISYGLYLLHELAYTLVFHVWKEELVRFSGYLHLAEWTGGIGTIIALSATILVAHLSYQFYERPFLRLRQRFTFIPSRDDASLGETARREACVQ